MLGQLITKVFTGEASIYIARLRTALVLYIVMALLGLAAIAFLLNALFTWLAFRYGHVQTSIGFGVVCLIGVAIMYVVLMVARRPPRQRARDRVQRDVASIASVAAVSNLPLIFRMLRRRKGLLLVPVGLASVWGLFMALRGYRDHD
ncbi:hypothetical protein [Aureimonas sp. AU20]|uniref:hypothetical protein n=1 Tax=Aureimonas sp. AU20 TaxID=1349819 RepID=UPI0007217F0B|nr:hypothetical protein [Aureimonas sp. AU20]ALN72691.1 hypothetical protein M673_08200 [Aureimonas sp. AU20]